ncbi:MAG: hypothetical protein SCARUB_04645 [Candidatus Scalindua rubra]|uniref:Uncharacterized protein n=1 Tax=Candidatus Scalindua rubra TaxID=1872076 RepID=A0A1E3X3R8_9BACT|nr:MAG: hypothetical protein SCARUB_04645 [Candidatus Scalindua rubra]
MYTPIPNSFNLPIAKALNHPPNFITYISPQQQGTPSSEVLQLYDALFASSGLSMVNCPAYGGLLSFAAVSVQTSTGSFLGNRWPSSSVIALYGP